MAATTVNTNRSLTQWWGMQLQSVLGRALALRRAVQSTIEPPAFVKLQHDIVNTTAALSTELRGLAHKLRRRIEPPPRPE